MNEPVLESLPMHHSGRRVVPPIYLRFRVGVIHKNRVCYSPKIETAGSFPTVTARGSTVAIAVGKSGSLLLHVVMVRAFRGLEIVVALWAMPWALLLEVS